MSHDVTWCHMMPYYVKQPTGPFHAGNITTIQTAVIMCSSVASALCYCVLWSYFGLFTILSCQLGCHPFLSAWMPSFPVSLDAILSCQPGCHPFLSAWTPSFPVSLDAILSCQLGCHPFLSAWMPSFPVSLDAILSCQLVLAPSSPNWQEGRAKSPKYDHNKELSVFQWLY